MTDNMLIWDITSSVSKIGTGTQWKMGYAMLSTTTRGECIMAQETSFDCSTKTACVTDTCSIIRQGQAWKTNLEQNGKQKP